MRLPGFLQPPLRRAAPAVQLEHSDILILPSWFGLFYLGLTAVLFVFGSNFQNNLILMLAFLMFSLFSSCLLVSFRNLSGLTLRFRPGRAAFAGENVGFPVELDSDRERFALTLALEQGDSRRLPSLGPQGHRLELTQPGRCRGLIRAGLFNISSRYPLGLCRAWARLRPDASCWVWPRPDRQTEVTTHSHDGSHHHNQWQELDGLVTWQPGHSLSRVDWKQLARQRGKMLKHFDEQSRETCWLELQPGHPRLEQHLSQLAGQALSCQRQGIPFGLRGPKLRIAPLQGEHQLRQVLNQLAAVPHGH